MKKLNDKKKLSINKFEPISSIAGKAKIFSLISLSFLLLGAFFLTGNSQTSEAATGTYVCGAIGVHFITGGSRYFTGEAGTEQLATSIALNKCRNHAFVPADTCEAGGCYLSSQ